MLAAGVRHLIAVTVEGQCYSWGDGSLGRLGHGDTTPVSEPRVISTLKAVKVVSAAAGEEHSACTTNEGLLYTWGSGSFGKLGHGEPTDESTPRKVALEQLAGGARAVEKVGCGFAHTIAICGSYDILVWGSGFKGKLGLGDDQNRLTPTPIPALKRKHIRDIACGSFHTIAVTETGKASAAAAAHISLHHPFPLPSSPSLTPFHPSPYPHNPQAMSSHGGSERGAS